MGVGSSQKLHVYCRYGLQTYLLAVDIVTIITSIYSVFLNESLYISTYIIRIISQLQGISKCIRVNFIG